MSEPDLELVRRGLEVWNQRDVDALLEMMAPEFEFVPAIAGTVEGAAVRGRDEFRAFFSHIDDTWDEFRVEADDVRRAGACLLFLGRIRAQGRGSGIAIDQPLFIVLWMREGKFVRMQSFLDLDEAVRVATGG